MKVSIQEGTVLCPVFYNSVSSVSTQSSRSVLCSVCQASQVGGVTVTHAKATSAAKSKYG
jgi:hypothetical protein